MGLLVDLKHDVLDPSAVQIVDRSVWERLRAVGVSRNAQLLIVAMADPADAAAVEELAIRTGLRIHAVRADEATILEAIDRSY